MIQRAVFRCCLIQQGDVCTYISTHTCDRGLMGYYSRSTLNFGWENLTLPLVLVCCFTTSFVAFRLVLGLIIVEKVCWKIVADRKKKQ